MPIHSDENTKEIAEQRSASYLHCKDLRTA